MPKPVYILCSESGSEDKITGLVSLFNLIEKIQIVKREQNEPVPSLSLRVTATWARGEDELDQLFEFETAAYLPPDNDEMMLGKGEFRFTMPFQRITMRMQGSLVFQGPGMLRIENRIRRAGTDEWFRQEYPILVEVQVPPAQTPSL